MDAIIAFIRENPQYSPATQQCYSTHLRQMARLLRVSRWRDVTADDLNRYVSYLALYGYRRSTIRTKYIAARSFARYLSEHHGVHLPVDVLPMMDSRHETLYVLAPEQVSRLLRQPEVRRRPKYCRDVAILALLCATGITTPELVGLNLDDVAWEDGLLWVGKRSIPVYPAALRTMGAYVHHARMCLCRDFRQRAMFVTWSGERMVRNGIEAIVTRYGLRAGIAMPVTPQILRHTFAMNLLYAGATPAELQVLLGCRSVDPVYRYYGEKKQAKLP